MCLYRGIAPVQRNISGANRECLRAQGEEVSVGVVIVHLYIALMEFSRMLYRGRISYSSPQVHVLAAAAAALDSRVYPTDVAVMKYSRASAHAIYIIERKAYSMCALRIVGI